MLGCTKVKHIIATKWVKNPSIATNWVELPRTAKHKCCPKSNNIYGKKSYEEWGITNQASAIIIIKITSIGANILHPSLIRNSWNLKTKKK